MASQFVLIALIAYCAALAASSDVHARGVSILSEELAGSCNALQCAAKGGRCGLDPSTLTLSMCPPSSQYCSNGVCADFLMENQECAQGGPENQCGGLKCLQTSSSGGGNFLCMPFVMKNNPGEDCSSDAQCYYYNNTQTTTPTPTPMNNSTCVEGKCYGNTAGEACVAGGVQCVVGLYCDTTSSSCRALRELGDACTDTSQCASGNCVPVTPMSSSRTCGVSHAVTEGGACETTDDCMDGFYCSPPASSSAWGVCTRARASSYKSCSSDNACAPHESCVCVAGSGTLVCMAPPVRPQNLTAAENATYVCATSFNCTSNECVLKNCASELCAYSSLMFGPAIWNDSMRNLHCVYGDVVVATYARCQELAPAVVGKNTSDATYLCILPIGVFFLINLIVILAL